MQENKKDLIVAVSGYFDPLHVGHIEYLEKAKKLGAKLIVIVNNDKQALLKKGFSFMKEDDRLKIIKSIKFVDEAIISIDEGKSVCKTLKLIKPDIFANGGDRNTSNIPEKKFCEEFGIKMIDGLGDKIRSSSDFICEFIEKVKKSFYLKDNY